MGGTTGTWAIPYPTGTDRVADGDNAIQALAERIDTLFNQNIATVAYATLGLNTGWTGTVRYGIRGGWVHLVANPTKAAWVANEIVCQIMVAAHRPKYSLFTDMIGANTAGRVSMQLDTSGLLTTILANSVDGGMVGYFAYPIGMP